MKKIINPNQLLSLVTSILLVVCCSQGDNLIDKREKLSKTIQNHYSSTHDSLKRKAIVFLLDNIIEKKHYIGNAYASFTDTLFKYHADIKVLKNRLKELENNIYEQKIDLDDIKPGYIIGNVDKAFEVHEKAAYSKNIGFHDFCEYNLPYRIEAEPLEYWRDSVLKEIPDSIFRIPDIKSAFLALGKIMTRQKQNYVLQFGGNSIHIPDLPYSSSKILPAGTCTEITHYGLFFLRAAGMAVAEDMTPFWANRSLGHSWCALVLDSVRSIPFNVPENIPGLYTDSDYRIAKVYRKIYSNNLKSHYFKRGYCAYLPAFLNDPHLIDVSEQYFKTFDLELPGLKPDNNSKFSYICVFNNKEWRTVSWGNIINNKACFKKMAGNIVYLAVTMNSQGMDYIGYPFIIQDNGDLKILKPELTSRAKIVITRKYPVFKHIDMLIYRMFGGSFQAANNEDFSDAINLYKIKENPGDGYKEVFISNTTKHRYYRYLSPTGSYGNIAELEFFKTRTDDKPSKGRIIGTIGSWQNNPQFNKESAFDGNPLTYVDSDIPDGNWVGLDIEKQVEIGKIRYLARTNCNFLFIGDEYELFFWNSGWQSLGRKIATSPSLKFDNAPKNALFLLHDLSGGNEERIFTYEDSKQVWW